MSAIIIGGGLAGLVAAYRLSQVGRRVTVLEAASALGGMIGRVEVGGILVDSGAEAYAVRGGVGRALCHELGLEVAPPWSKPHVYFGKGAFPMAEGVLGIPASPDDPALKVLSDTERAEVIQDLKLGPEVGSEAATVGELVRARMGEGAVARLAGPVALSIYGTPPDKLALVEVAPTLMAALSKHGSLMAAVAAVRSPGGAAVEQPVGGMFRLIDALRDAVIDAGGSIRLATPVASIARHGSGFLVLPRNGEELEVQRVVLATPATAACALLGEFGVDVTAPMVRRARIVTLAIDHPALLEAPIGSGALVAEPADALAPKAITHYSVKWPWAQVGGVSVLRVSYPGGALPGREQAIADAARLSGVPFDDQDVLGVASLGWDAMPTRIESSTRDHLVERAATAGLDVVGAWIDGNGIASVIAGCARVLR